MQQKTIKKHLLIVLVLISNINFSQDLILSGSVKGDDNKVLPYVNIGIKNKNIGTISDDIGNFKFIVTKEHKSDSLSFSYLGYHELSIKIEDILNKDISEFILTEKPSTLDEVTLIYKKSKEKKLGTKSYVGFVAGYVRVNNDKNKNILEFAKKITIKKPSKILDVNINLFHKNVDSARFRINFYSIKDNLPFQRIGAENIIIEQKINNGWNIFDLTKHNLKFKKPIFITLEYIPNDANPQEPFRYSGQLFGTSLSRSSSLGKWDVKKGITMAMYVTVRQ